MHLASEVSSTTNHSTIESAGMNNNNNNNNATNNNNNNNNNSSVNSNKLVPLTAETLAERTLDGLMSEHPGELVRTGSPHVVSQPISLN